MNHVIGADGGCTKTVALVVSLDGEVVGAGRAGPADIGSLDPGNRWREVDLAITSALREAGVEKAALRHAGFGMASAAGPDSVDDFRRTLTAGGLGSGVTVVVDVLASLRAASAEGIGVVLAAGTGMGLAAKGPSGLAWCHEFWPIPGGATGLGQSALHAVFRQAIGDGPATSLTERTLDAFRAHSVDEVIERLNEPGMVFIPSAQSRLSAIVLDEAEAGDEVALVIVRGFGDMIGGYAASAARRVGFGPGPVPVFLSGGVFRHPSPIYRDAVRASVAKALPGSEVRPARFEPAAGAALLALEACGVEITPELLDRLEATMPPATLFDSLTPRWGGS